MCLPQVALYHTFNSTWTCNHPLAMTACLHSNTNCSSIGPWPNDIDIVRIYMAYTFLRRMYTVRFRHLRITHSIKLSAINDGTNLRMCSNLRNHVQSWLWAFRRCFWMLFLTGCWFYHQYWLRFFAFENANSAQNNFSVECVRLHRGRNKEILFSKNAVLRQTQERCGCCGIKWDLANGFFRMRFWLKHLVVRNAARCTPSQPHNKSASIWASIIHIPDFELLRRICGRNLFTFKFENTLCLNNQCNWNSSSTHQQWSHHSWMRCKRRKLGLQNCITFCVRFLASKWCK